MRARTHTELYRRFEGERRGSVLRFRPLVDSAVRTALKGKLALLVLYGPVAVTTIVFSFLVHGKYAGQGLGRPEGMVQAVTRAVARGVAQRIQVADTIAEANDVLRLFALLAVAWYGAGAIAEDRRLGASLLYFSRPLTRLDYFLGKLLAVAFFGALASIVPGLVICAMAALSSPEWSFLKDEWEVVLQTVAHGAVWIAVTASVVLCASALTRRRTHALAGTFGFFVLGHALGGVLGLVDGRYQAISLILCLESVRNWIFDVQGWRGVGFGVGTAFGVLAVAVLGSLSVVAWRIRRMEVAL